MAHPAALRPARDNTVATNAPSDASRTSRPVDRKDAKYGIGQHAHPCRKVEGLVLRKRGGSSSLPGRIEEPCKPRPFAALEAESEQRSSTLIRTSRVFACLRWKRTDNVCSGSRPSTCWRRGRLASSFGGRSTQSGGRRFGSPGARSPQRLPARDVRQRSEPRAARLLLASCMNGRATARTPGGRRGPSVRIDRARTPASTLESERHRP
jgi:hypothetical protein